MALVLLLFATLALPSAQATVRIFSLTVQPGEGGSSCWPNGPDGDACDGQDPVGTGCASDAAVKDSQSYAGSNEKIELMWSKACNTVWARYTAPSGWGCESPTDYSPSSDYNPTVTRRDGLASDWETGGDCTNGVYQSTMLDRQSQQAQACNGAPPGWGQLCTNWA
jgi:hypothetical protein